MDHRPVSCRGEYLTPGDAVRIGIAACGRLANPIIARAA